MGRLYLAELHLVAAVYNLCSFKFILGKSRFPLAETQNSEYLAYFNTWLHIKLPEGQNWANVEISDLKSEKPFKMSRGFVLFNTDESRMCLSEKKVKNERNQSNTMTKIGKSDEKTISCWGKKKKNIEGISVQLWGNVFLLEANHWTQLSSSQAENTIPVKTLCYTQD